MLHLFFKVLSTNKDPFGFNAAHALSQTRIRVSLRPLCGKNKERNSS
jgi:hypothetical protein